MQQIKQQFDDINNKVAAVQEEVRQTKNSVKQINELLHRVFGRDDRELNLVLKDLRYNRMSRELWEIILKAGIITMVTTFISGICVLFWWGIKIGVVQ